MLYVDLPSRAEFLDLDRQRADICVSIYLETTPLTQHIDKSRIQLGNLVKSAVAQLQEAGTEKRRIWPLEEQFDALLADDDFWNHQANSLAILATPEAIRTYRLANRLNDMVEVSGRFHLKPLLRAITHSQSAYVLALSENDVRLVEMSGDLPATKVHVPSLPKDAASAVGKASINDPSSVGRIQGLEGQKVHLTQYIRKIDAALRPVLAHSDSPVVLASTLPIASLFRSVSTLSVLPEGIEGSPDRLSEADLAAAARPVLDAEHQARIDAFRQEFERLSGAGLAVTDIADAARAATFGAIDTLLVDIDAVVDGFVDEETGAVTFDDTENAANYGVIDEIAGRAMRAGATVLGVRRADLPGDHDLAATLRYAL